eukprot:15860367-Heterocapsa_arctica.AAC.1
MDEQDRLDWDNQQDRKLGKEEKDRQDLENAAQAEQDEKQRLEEKAIKDLDNKGDADFMFSEKVQPWITDLTGDQ